jgi:hypothetical protein
MGHTQIDHLHIDHHGDCLHIYAQYLGSHRNDDAAPQTDAIATYHQNHHDVSLECRAHKHEANHKNKGKPANEKRPGKPDEKGHE